MRSSNGGHPRAIALEHRRRARAARAVVAQPSARTGVHGGDKLYVGGKHGRAAAARDGQASLLERLAQRLERVAPELGQLVEEEHAAVRERKLAGADGMATAEERGVGDGGVRGAERARGDERAVTQQAGDAVDRGDLDRLGEGEPRQDGRQSTREHGLSRARGPEKKDVVRPGRRDLERALGERLAADVGEIARGRGSVGQERGGVDAGGGASPPAAEMGHRVGQRPDADHGRAARARALSGIDGRDQHAV